MIPATQRRAPRNSSKVNLIISVTFHGVLVGALLYFAAREGLLGKQIKKIAVEMVKEKKPEKPKAPEKPKEIEQPKVETPKVATVEAPRAAPPPSAAPAAAAPPAVAPASVDVASFAFEGGRAVETSSDPIELYKGWIQTSIQSRWNRPEDMGDKDFVAEVEVSVDKTGDIGDAVWKKSSGNKRWDDSVKQALAATKNVNRIPPKNFPTHVTVRFDVIEAQSVFQ
jgi:TonB family protein